MKLQYLGDSRDAFKWDLLHWLCARSVPSFSCLVFIPLLTPDDNPPCQGRTPAFRFPCRNDNVRGFVASLGSHRALGSIRELGGIDGEWSFEVTIHEESRFVRGGSARAAYWQGWWPGGYGDSILFFDPDNGFETKTQRGAKWVCHDELAATIAQLPASSALAVYQHRPRRPWQHVFGDLECELRYVPFAVAVYEANLVPVSVTMATYSNCIERAVWRMLPQRTEEVYAEAQPIYHHPVTGRTPDPRESRPPVYVAILSSAARPHRLGRGRGPRQ